MFCSEESNEKTGMFTNFNFTTRTSLRLYKTKNENEPQKWFQVSVRQ